MSQFIEMICWDFKVKGTMSRIFLKHNELTYYESLSMISCDLIDVCSVYTCRLTLNNDTLLFFHRLQSKQKQALL